MEITGTLGVDVMVPVLCYIGTVVDDIIKLIIYSDHCQQLIKFNRL